MSKLSEDKMRSSSGPVRLLCSPYFTGSAIILLSIISVRHWTIAGQNEELTVRLDMLQTQLKTDKFNIQNLESTLSQKNAEVNKCSAEKAEMQKQIDQKAGEVGTKQAELEEANKRKADMENQLGEVREQARLCEEQKQGVSDKLNQAEGDKNALVEKEQVIQNLKVNIANLESQLAKRPAAASDRDNETDVKGISAELPGQLPDVKVAAVEVAEKAVKGSPEKETELTDKAANDDQVVDGAKEALDGEDREAKKAVGDGEEAEEGEEDPQKNVLKAPKFNLDAAEADGDDGRAAEEEDDQDPAGGVKTGEKKKEEADEEDDLKNDEYVDEKKLEASDDRNKQ